MASGKPRYQANETYVSTEQIEARSHSRLSRPHGDQGRPPRAQAPPRQGPREAHAVNGQGSVLPGLTGTPPQRFKKDNRLLSAAAFARVFEKATRSRDKWFTVLCRDNHQDIARLGLAISKKNCRHATGRNRIKRVIRESFRQHQGQLTGLDVIVLNQSAAAAAANQTLFDSLDRHWQKCARQAQEQNAQE